MGFRNGAYATIWEVNPTSQTMTKVRISTSKKDKQTGNWETDFSGFVAFVGAKNAELAAHLNAKDRVKLGDIDVTTKYDKDKKITYTNFACFGFEMANNGGGSAEAAVESAVEKAAEQDDPEGILSDGAVPF